MRRARSRLRKSRGEARCSSVVNIAPRRFLAKPVPPPPPRPRCVFQLVAEEEREREALACTLRALRFVRVKLCNESMGDVRFQGTGMEKENSASGGGGGGGGGGGAEAAAAATPGATSTSDKLQADQANPLLDPTALFGGKSFSLVSCLPFSAFPSRVLAPRVYPFPPAPPPARRRAAISGVVMRDGERRRGRGRDQRSHVHSWTERLSVIFRVCELGSVLAWESVDQWSIGDFCGCTEGNFRRFSSIRERVLCFYILWKRNGWLAEVFGIFYHDWRRFNSSAKE